MTVTAGLRWDPFFGHTDPKGHVVSISLPDMINNVHSTKFPTAPAGYLFNGDPGGPSSNKLTQNALDKWSPRIGVAWDPMGDGRMSVRAGFGIFYDFPNFSYDQFGFEEPYGGAVTSCQRLHDDVHHGSLGELLLYGPGRCHAQRRRSVPAICRNGPNECRLPPGLPGIQLSAEHQAHLRHAIQPQRGKASGCELAAVGHLPGESAAPPLGKQRSESGMQGPCPVAYPLPNGVSCTPGPCIGAAPPFTCPLGFSAPASAGRSWIYNLSENRMFQHYGSLCSPTTSCYGETLLLEEGGTGNYNGLLLSAQHRFANHYTSTSNFTWSHCISDNYTTTLGFFLAAESVPFDRRADRGNCPSARYAPHIQSVAGRGDPQILGPSDGHIPRPLENLRFPLSCNRGWISLQ